jgi:hypothetical protein
MKGEGRRRFEVLKGFLLSLLRRFAVVWISSLRFSMNFQDDADLCAECGIRQNAESNMTNTLFEVCTDPKCGHKFCSNCLHDLFSNQGKRQFACKRCTASGRQILVRKDKLSKKSLEETEVEKDVRVRKKVLAIYNKNESSFPNARAFKDYEEEVEDLIYNLVHDINVAETQARIKKYASLNEESIAFNEGKRSEEDQVLDKAIRLQSAELYQKLNEIRAADEEERLYQRERKRQVNQLMLGERETIDVQRGGAHVAINGDATNAAAQQQLYLASQQSVFQLLNPRELPKPLEIHTFDRRALSQMSKEDKRLMHAAAGYDHTEWFRKSWTEIVTSITGEECRQQNWD